MLISAVSGAADLDAPRQAPPVSVPALSPERAFLKDYCVGCHNTTLKNPAGSLALDTPDVTNISSNADLWEKVVRKLRARAMPPPGPGRRRPDETAYDRF